jgi:hypothetical protein
MPGKGLDLIWINKILAWILTILSLLMLSSGYLLTRVVADRAFLTILHTGLGLAFLVLLIFHFYLSVFVVSFPWRSTLRRVLDGDGDGIIWLRLIQRLSAWILLGASLLVVISGLGWYSFRSWQTISFQPHVFADVLLLSTMVIHVGASLKFTLLRRGITGTLPDALLLLGIVLLIFSGLYTDTFLGRGEGMKPIEPEPGLEPGPHVNNTLPLRMGSITVGSETFEFHPREVNTNRPDIFRPGHFSMFDVLVHVAERGLITLDYHFNESMNTHWIDSINGETGWWYTAYYEGGWPESNAYRPDHYPWKDGTTLIFSKFKPSRLEKIPSIFVEEGTRQEANDGRVIIPRVIINGRKFKGEFHDVEVKAHNLRNDTLQEGVITALDVILSLGDQGELEYGLKWYETIGTAGVVKNYWVEEINQDEARGRCGFVYEAGDLDLQGFQGNHIHLPSDTRTLNSPEYLLFFWICL